jgi:lysophospholipase L1-like esterase
MTMKLMRGAAAALVLGLVAVSQSPATAQGGNGGAQWVTTWHTAVVPRAAMPPQQGQGQPPLNFNNQTLRQIVHVSLGGDRIRVVLSNAFGTEPLMVGAAGVALRQKDAVIAAGSSRPLTFDGRRSVSIPPGAVILSDPVALPVSALADVVVDVHIPGDTGARTSPLTTHGNARQTSYVSTTGNHVGAAELPVASTTQSWFFLTSIEVAATGPAGVIAGLGDSITEGNGSTPDTNGRWPDVLAKRLAARAGPTFGIANGGIGGNRVLSGGTPNALARFDRDVLAQPGVTHVIFTEGINDLRITAQNPNSIPLADLIAGHKQIIERARAHGLTIYGGTLVPYEGTQGWTKETDETRIALNNWIRTSKAYDAVIDFDAAIRDPAQPSRILAKFDSGDHLHPNNAGYEAMAHAIDLALFTAGAPARTTNTR